MAKRPAVGNQQEAATVVSDVTGMVGSDTETLERLFPKCRVKSFDKSPLELESISSASMLVTQSVPNMASLPPSESRTGSSSALAGNTTLNLLPQSHLGSSATSRRRSHQNIMYRRDFLKNTEHRRRPRPKTLDIMTSYYDSQAGYDPSPDSDEGLPDEPDYHVGSSSSGPKMSAKCIREEPATVELVKEQHLRHHKAHKEVVQMANPPASQPHQDSRIELAGGREVVSRSRAKAATKKRHVSNLGLHLVSASGVGTPGATATQQALVHPPSAGTTTLSAAGTPSWSAAARNRYSGEVFYEESLGRYGFHVDGNTLWGNRGLEPNFIDLDDKDDGSSGKFASPLTDSSIKSQTGGGRPVSWSGAENLLMSTRPIADETPTTTTVLTDTMLTSGQLRVAPSTPSPQPGHKEETAALSESEYVALIQMGGYLTDLYADLQKDHGTATTITTATTTTSHRSKSNSLAPLAPGPSHVEDLLLLDFPATLQELPCQPEDKTSTCLIGGVPIAQYDGSPRRYGPRPSLAHDNGKGPAAYLPHHSSNSSVSSSNSKKNGQSASLPRPGFPRRVTLDDGALINGPVTFAPSQTRQSLAELCSLSNNTQDSEVHHEQVLEEKLMVPSDLDYVLRRQFGNAYVASRLAQSDGLAEGDEDEEYTGNGVSEETTRMNQGFEVSTEVGEVLLASPAPELGNECDRDTASTEDLGETEVGLVVGQSRNFTLSPETTDCDSELESPPSDGLSAVGEDDDLDPAQHRRRSSSQLLKPRHPVLNHNGGMTAGRPGLLPAAESQLESHRDCRRFGSMPVLEDGLSSGHTSDVDVVIGTPGGAASAAMASAGGPSNDFGDKRPSRLSGPRNGALAVNHIHRHGLMTGGPATQNGSSSHDKSSPSPAFSHPTPPPASCSGALGSPVSPQAAHTPSRLPFDAYVSPSQQPPVGGWRKKANANNNYHVSSSSKPDYQRQVEHFLRSQNIPSYTNTSQPNNSDLDGLESLRSRENGSPPPPPAPRSLSPSECNQNHSSQEQLHHSHSVQQLVDLGGRLPGTGTTTGSEGVKPENVAIQELRDALRQTRNRHSLKIPTATTPTATPQQSLASDTAADFPVWVPRLGSGNSGGHWKSSSKANGNHEEVEDEEQKETDELLAEDEHPPDNEFFDEKDRLRTGSHNRRPSSTLPSSSNCTSSATPSSAASTSKSSPSASNRTASIVEIPAAAGELALADEGSASPRDNAVFTSPKASQEETTISGKKKGRTKEVMVHEPAVLIEGVLFRAHYLGSTQLVCEGAPTKITRMMQAEEAVSRIKLSPSIVGNNNEVSPPNEEDEDKEPEQEEVGGDQLESDTLVRQRMYLGESLENNNVAIIENVLSSSTEMLMLETPLRKLNHLPERGVENNEEEQEELEAGLEEEGMGHELEEEAEDNLLPWTEHEVYLSHDVINGCTFRLRYFGAMEICETDEDDTKYRSKKTMVEEAVTRLKAPEGETQPSTEVDLFISTEKIMVLNTDLKEIMMDHALRTISYIADIGDLVVLMARRRVMPPDGEEGPQICPTPKMICHVFESEEAQFIAQSIGQAFQVAYMEFLKANGIEDQSFVREMDYQEVLNSQEIFGDELQMFAKKELQKEVIVPKARGEILGMVIVESGWGSMLPTVVIANLSPAGAAARCGQLNIGDQIIAINGVSLVGLPLSTCQGYVKNAKSSTAVKLTVVPCPPVVEVKIKRPDTKYQLGFSVQNGVICSLLRGGIAERGGVRVGHRIIEINGQSVVAVPHERIVGLLATSVGEIHMKTMPTSMFRLLTGQETPVYL